MNPVHFDPSISLGAVVGWAITALSVAYGFGKLVAAIDNLGKGHARLEDNFEVHCEDDVKRFTSLGEQLTTVATAINARR